MMWLTPLKPSAVRLLGRPPPQGVQDFLALKDEMHGVIHVADYQALSQLAYLQPGITCSLGSMTASDVALTAVLVPTVSSSFVQTGWGMPGNASTELSLA
ncbi:hypothetical protein HaLaN_07803, partial [Haematococcus lacustris]